MSHATSIYDDSGETSLDYELLADTDYYYKITICDDVDEGGACATSACSSLRTSAANRCPYCNFENLRPKKKKLSKYMRMSFVKVEND